MRQFPQKLWNLIRQLKRQRLEQSKSRRGWNRRLELEILEDRSLPAVSATGVLSGVAFIDQNNNGVFDAGEVVLPGVSVTLTGTTTQGASVSTTTATDGNGAYSFNNVLPGTYQIGAGPVSGLLGGAPAFTSAGAPSGEDLISGLVVADGQTVNQNLGFLGQTPTSISLRQFLTTTTAADFPAMTEGAGAGSASVNAPFVSNPIADVSVPVNSSPTTINLAGNFSESGVTNTEVTFNTSDGPLNVDLFNTTAPQTVANFLDYVNSGAYNSSIFSRLVSGFVLQGGGATLQATSSGSSLSEIPVNAPVPNEFSASNTLGTLAMAQSSGDPNSATDQFFFNLANNNASGTTNLDAQQFTVFGQVATASDEQFLLNTLATTPAHNESSSAAASSLPTVDLADVPLNNYSGTNFPTDAAASNFLTINSISVDSGSASLAYSVTANSNPNLVTTSVQNENLTLNYAAGQTGSSTITVQATDPSGAVVSDTFTVTVNPQPPVVESAVITPDNPTNTTVLTVAPTTTDPQGAPVTNTYQWLQNGAPIAGATASTLNLTTQVSSVKVGDQFSVQITPNDGTLTGDSFTSNPVTVATTSPITLSPPVVDSVTIAPDSPTNTTMLTATPTTTDPQDAPVTDSYQWLQNGKPIAGATAQTLNLTTQVSSLKAGDQFSVQVTPNAATISGAVFTSDPVTIATASPITLKPPTVSAVTITPSSPTTTSTLTANPTSSDPATFSYQWLQGSTLLTGSTSQTLDLTTLTPAVTAGETFSVKVTPNEGALIGSTFTSKSVTVS